jgi:catechol 2,3-dioxygenase-like lactoylglutathione lyase family enzyme
MTIAGFDHVVITAADLDATCAFYDKLFGLKVLLDYAPEGKSKARQVLIGAGTTMLSIHQRGSGITPVAVNPTVGAVDLCFRWAGLIDEAEALLARHGVAIIEGPSPRLYSDGRTSLSVYFRDPDGNLIELMAPDLNPERAGDTWDRIGAAHAAKAK